MFQLTGISIERDKRRILDIPSLQIPTNQLTVVLGHNGSGKSTLVNLLSGQDKQDEGKVTFNDNLLSSFKPKDLAKNIAFLPQSLPSAEGLTVKELVYLGRFPWRGVFGRFKKEDKKVVEKSMEQTGVLQFQNTLVSNLSGGERQRAFISMLLAQQSGLLIFDEPISALDVCFQYQIMALLEDLNKKQGCGIIVVLHDLNLALRYASYIVALKQGRVFFQGKASNLVNDCCLSEIYKTPIKLINNPFAETSKNNKVAIVCT